MAVGEGVDADGVVGGVAAEAEGIGEGRFAFEDEDGAVFDAGGPLGGGGRAGAGDEDAGEGGGLGEEADGGEDGGPGAGVVGEDGEVGVGGGEG